MEFCILRSWPLNPKSLIKTERWTTSPQGTSHHLLVVYPQKSWALKGTFPWGDDSAGAIAEVRGRENRWPMGVQMVVLSMRYAWGYEQHTQSGRCCLAMNRFHAADLYVWSCTFFSWSHWLYDLLVVIYFTLRFPFWTVERMDANGTYTTFHGFCPTISTHTPRMLGIYSHLCFQSVYYIYISILAT